MLQKRLDYGFDGYQAPPTPRAPRSARRRGPILQKKVDDNRMCAFDLLATLAGKLLLEGDMSPPEAAALTKSDVCKSVDARGNGTEEKNVVFHSVKLKAGDSDQVNPGISLRVQGIVSPADDRRCKETVNAQGGSTTSGIASVVTSSSNGSGNINFEDRMVIKSDKSDKSEIGCHSSKLLSSGDKSNCSRYLSKLGSVYDSSYRGLSCVVSKLEDCTKPLMSPRPANIDTLLFGTGPHLFASENPKLSSNDNEPPLLVGSYSNNNSIVASVCKENCPNIPVSLNGDNVKIVSKDDDENSYECSRPSSKTKKSRSVPIVGNRRIRKLLASRCWRIVPPTMKDGDLSDNGGEFRSVYRNRIISYKRQRSPRIYPLKKRKIFHCMSNLDEGITCDSIYNLTERENMDMNASGLGALWHGVGKSPSLGEHDSASVQSRESHVNLRIKSFRVPELFMEVPETATVGSLKKTVLDALTAMLGGGLHVGVHLQGKKIRDDGKTLLQSGISCDDEAKALGFSLEPNSSPQILQPDSSEDRGLVVFSNERQPVLRSLPAANGMGLQRGTSHASTSDYQATNLSNHNFIESDHDSVSSTAENSSAEKSGADSRALVAVPDGSAADPLTAVPPLNQKCKLSDMPQRRIRRPFSVAEVEALVQAVETLGTGRWRDVKLLAFDNVKHRTYVDLKDKWKTLVHTARIAPQQRRGEPVPQELLDRVLIAHGYWSQLQPKQLKQQTDIACLIA